MRFFYFMLYVTLNYSLRVFFRNVKTVNAPKGYLGRTIYVSNHASSFMDPIAVASLRRPIVFFMTRSDVFTSFTKPFLWAAHMLPIYRQQDGVDTKDENARVFAKCTKILSFGRNLLIFGEGFTDDIFIRRLKPIKKGAIRIGFTALESLNWKKKIYVAAVGCNYSDPTKMRSDLLIATSERFCLNDYKDAYEENPNKTIAELTKKVELMMQSQITHIEDKQWAEFHEQCMIITRKGMSAISVDRSIPLVKRWKYSQQLAVWINARAKEELETLEPLKDDLKGYFSLLRKLKLNESDLYEIAHYRQLSTWKEIVKLIVLAPTAILGLLHCGIIYFLVKRFVEKTFRRKVFWSSVKLLIAKIALGLLNLPVIFLFHAFVYPSYWMGFIYYALIGLFGLSTYVWWTSFIRFREKKKTSQVDLGKIIERRTSIQKKITEQIPVA